MSFVAFKLAMNISPVLFSPNTQRESGGEPEWSGFDTAAPQGEDGSATDAQHAFFQNSRQ